VLTGRPEDTRGRDYADQPAGPELAMLVREREEVQEMPSPRRRRGGSWTNAAADPTRSRILGAFQKRSTAASS